MLPRRTDGRQAVLSSGALRTDATGSASVRYTDTPRPWLGGQLLAGTAQLAVRGFTGSSDQLQHIHDQTSATAERHTTARQRERTGTETETTD